MIPRWQLFLIVWSVAGVALVWVVVLVRAALTFIL